MDTNRAFAAPQIAIQSGYQRRTEAELALGSPLGLRPSPSNAHGSASKAPADAIHGRSSPLREREFGEPARYRSGTAFRFLDGPVASRIGRDHQAVEVELLRDYVQYLLHKLLSIAICLRCICICRICARYSRTLTIQFHRIQFGAQVLDPRRAAPFNLRIIK